jgi:putative transposase
MVVSVKGAHFPWDIMRTGVRWYLAYPLSPRHVEELRRERGVCGDHSSLNRWVTTYSPLLEAAFHPRKRPVWRRWRLDETYLKVKGQWGSRDRAVDKTGQTMDCLLTEPRHQEAARRVVTKAIHRHGVPATMTIDGSEANAAAVKRYHTEHGTTMIIRQVK